LYSSELDYACFAPACPPLAIDVAVTFALIAAASIHHRLNDCLTHARLLDLPSIYSLWLFALAFGGGAWTWLDLAHCPSSIMDVVLALASAVIAVITAITTACDLAHGHHGAG